MPRSVRVATIQMDGTPASTAERLQRAEELVQTAVDEGAELVVLPAMFNTGSAFSEVNYEITERLSDMTMQWLCEQAKKHQIHLAGSWMIVDKDDTFHAAFLISPDGTTWRYDQQYPYLWERVFYRDGHGLCVAETSLGKIGILIGWDAAHPDIWERYAAKVDLLLVMNTTLDTEQASLQYIDNTRIQVHEWGTFAHWLANSSACYLHDDLEGQANWLNIPIVCAGASGEFSSILPAPFFSVQALLLGRPALWDTVDKQYADMTLKAPFQHTTRILDATGNTLARVLVEGDGLVTHTIELKDKTPLPLDKAQPEMSVPKSALHIIDLIASALLVLNYRRGVRRQWGARMAPIDNSTRVWLAVLMVVAGISAILGRFLIPKR